MSNNSEKLVKEALIKYVPRHAGEYQHPVSYCFYWFLACARMTTCCILRLNQSFLKDIRRRTRKKYSSEEKIRIVLEGMRGEESIAELCRREGLNQNVYYRWSKEFLEAGKQRLAGDIKREATSTEVTDLKKENDQLKRLMADIMLKNDVLKKSVLGLESTWEDE